MKKEKKVKDKFFSGGEEIKPSVIKRSVSSNNPYMPSGNLMDNVKKKLRRLV